MLAVGTKRGVVLWDLARGTELAFLAIGHAWNVLFEESGDLLTTAIARRLRWPVRVDPDRGEFRIGPPRRLPLPAGIAEIAEDRHGPDRRPGKPSTASYVLTPERTVPGRAARRRAAESPSARTANGWRPAVTRSAASGSGDIRDGKEVLKLPIEGGTGVRLQSRWDDG